MGNDLFNLVYSRKKHQHQGFWGKYAYLNQYDTSSYNDFLLWKLQITRLKTKEEYGPSFKYVNQFLSEIEQTSIHTELNEMQEMSNNAIYTRILELLNAGLVSSPLSPVSKHLNKQEKGFSGYKKGSNKSTMEADKINLVNELETLLQAINSSKVDGRVKRLAHALGGLGQQKIDLQDHFNTYKQYKAHEAEELAVEALNQHEGWRAVQTGQLIHKGQMLLEDAFVFDATIDINFESSIGATVKKNGVKTDIKLAKLSEFFQLVENMDFNESIILSDELYAKIQEIKLFAVQAKSGIQLQPLLNAANQRNAISIQDVGDTAILRDLYWLYKDQYLDSIKDSNLLVAMTNYWLSKNILLTNISNNELYFTKDGFHTASQWMELHKQMLKFNPPLSRVSNAFFNHPHPYIFQSILT